ncbi:hypothetical protein LCD39_12795 [Enterobacter asburiae]|nr:hypothetical protein [Enterobacter asburiae]UOZ16776.1 hypothetical protein LCD39_12795 [Enterobacter asburiae]
MFAGKKSAQIREILISESAWEEMTCLFAPSLADFLDAFCSAIEIEQSKYDGDATDDDFNFREDFLEDIDLMLKSKLKDVEAEAFKYFFFG